MTLLIHPRLSGTPGRLALFVADLQQSALRPISFTLDGVPSQPRALRPLSAVRDATLGVPANSSERRAFTGVYEFSNLRANSLYRVGVSVGNERQWVDTWTLPERVSSASEGGFDVLLASCFCRYEESKGALQSALRNLQSALRAKRTGMRAPDCSLFMGDQVYLDLPTLADFPDDSSKLARRFEADYAHNWSTSLAPFLQLAPSACVPDDHEFWNNAPHAATLIGNSWTKGGRDRWGRAARACYEAFAKPCTSAGTDSTDDPLVFDVHPLSFFLADGRSKRDPGKRFTLTDACRQRLRRWVGELNESGRVGVFLTGQSLLRARTNPFVGAFVDYELPNYGDYQEILRTLGSARNRLLLLTGDVHWSRVSTGLDKLSRAEKIQEVIVSPLTLVTGPPPWQRDPVWPRHSAGEEPPDRLSLGDAVNEFRVAFAEANEPAAIKGDQLGLLSFDWTHARLRACVRYFPVHATRTQSVTVPLFDIALP